MNFNGGERILEMFGDFVVDSFQGNLQLLTEQSIEYTTVPVEKL